MLLYYFQYIPDINWEDPLVSTDEGILELCKCPKDKCKHFVRGFTVKRFSGNTIHM